MPTKSGALTTVRVKPVQGGWLVDNNAAVMPLVFSSGASAERSAKRLARVVAHGGDQAQVVVHDRAGTVVGSVVFGPD
jgi:hypothetical protein